MSLVLLVVRWRVFANFLDGQLISARGRSGAERRRRTSRRIEVDGGVKGSTREKRARVPRVVLVAGDARASGRWSLGRESVAERSPIPIPAS